MPESQRSIAIPDGLHPEAAGEIERLRIAAGYAIEVLEGGGKAKDAISALRAAMEAH